MISFSEFKTLKEMAGGSVAGHFDVLDLTADKAREIAVIMLSKENMKIETVYPEFSKNFNRIHKLLGGALGTQRKEMPVIASYQVDDFKKHLDKERIKAAYKYQEAGKLKPIQSQVYFDKLVNADIVYGGMEHGSTNTEKTMIVSKDSYIIDGHHRWATAMLNDPTVKIKTLVVDMDIQHLLKYAMQYGISIGNEQNH
jgi:hypothetical protein